MDHLIALVYAPNNCYVQVKSLDGVADVVKVPVAEMIAETKAESV